MNEDVIELYDTFNAKVCPDEILFGDFHYRPIPPGYYYFLYDNDNYEYNTPGNPVEGVFMDTEGVEDGTFMPNAPDINDNDFKNMIQKMMIIIVKPWPLTPSKTKQWTLKKLTRTMKK